MAWLVILWEEQKILSKVILKQLVGLIYTLMEVNSTTKAIAVNVHMNIKITDNS